ncbi:MAG TPA: DUF4344 domain-containing metallopeptidase [Longimicrobium sp.]|jgi:hypothetical protein|uniref:DUF4344 domain-containing metallopeptidase n=1 Tax=Longimicrobium sp. TaxID=2029185 RepID=UPI002ED9AB91
MRTLSILSTTAAALAILYGAVMLITPSAGAQGRFVAAYPVPADSVFLGAQQSYMRQRTLEGLAAQMNGLFLLPRDITLELAECGKAKALYPAEPPVVRLCYELLTVLADELLNPKDPEGLEMNEAFFYLWLHGIGHALIRELRLPVDMPPEEAADQFVVWAVGSARPGDVAGALPGVTWVHSLIPSWDAPDSLDPDPTAERFQKTICLLYGAHPRNWGYVADRGHLGARSPAECVGESRRVRARWAEMLAPHLRR